MRVGPRFKLVAWLAICALVYDLLFSGRGQSEETTTTTDVPCVSPRSNLIRNPNFEEWEGDPEDLSAVGWQFFDKGYEISSNQKHNGNHSIYIPGNIDRDHSGKLLHHRGATQFVLLDQKVAEPLIVSAWSKPDGVEVNVYDNGEPVPDVRYVLSADVRYVDGTHEDELMIKFEFDVPDWHRQCIIIDPAKPIFSVTVQLLFFGHIGSVWFDQVSLHIGDRGPPSMNVAIAGPNDRCWRHRIGVPTFSSFKTLPDFVVAAHPAEVDDTTIVTQLSMDRLHILRDMALMWEGPISAAVYVPCTLGCHPDKNDILTRLRHPAVQQWVSLHLVMAHGDRYPVNVLRNVALRNTHSEHVLLLDVDFLPSHGLRDALTERYKRRRLSSDAREVWVAPAFEFLKPIGEDLSLFPRNKQQLVKLLEQEDLIQPVHQFYKPAHGATNINKWYNTTEVYEAKYETYYEPYVVSNLKIPDYDERFIGYGNDKASHLYELAYAGYKFMVLPDVFVIHMFHEAPAWRAGSNREQVHVWRTWYNFVNDIQYRYNSTSMYSVCQPGSETDASSMPYSPTTVMEVGMLLFMLFALTHELRGRRSIKGKGTTNYAV